MKHHNRGVFDWLTVAACALLLAAVFAGYQWAWSNGYAERDQIAQADDKARQAAAATQAQQQANAARDTDKRLRDEAAKLNAQLQESQHHATTLQTQLDRALRAGSQRLSIRTTSCQPAAIPADRAAEPGAAGAQETRAELLAEDAADLAAIAADASQATRELNSCIDRYNAAKTALDEWASTNWKGRPHVEAP